MDKNFTHENISRVATKLEGDIVRTPLLRLNIPTKKNIYLKLETLQPIGAFKIRGAGNAIKSTSDEILKEGIWTVSAGNMAQGVAWYAKKLGYSSTILVPETAPQAKLDAITALKGKIIKLPMDEWFSIMETGEFDGMTGHFVHPFADELVMQGNATIGLEIFQDLPEVDTIIVPYGGGGLISGIARYIKQVKPEVKVFACEPETAAAVYASIQAGEPKKIEYTPSFVDGMGAPLVFSKMWKFVSKYITDSLVVSLKEIADAVGLLMTKNNVVAEGAGAAPVAAALHPKFDDKLGENIVCVISGGNIDAEKLAKILRGIVP